MRNSPVAERRNLAFKGTLVAGGRGTGVVVATGMDTQIGRIAMLLHKDGIPRTPLPAVKLCRSAGITPVMITGDHPGRELERLSAEELQARIARTRVFARVTPRAEDSHRTEPADAQ